MRARGEKYSRLASDKWTFSREPVTKKTLPMRTKSLHDALHDGDACDDGGDGADGCRDVEGWNNE